MANGANTEDPDHVREELVDIAADYFDALVAGDPHAVPIAEDAAFVENLERKTPGEGLWETASERPTDFQLTVPDPVAGQVGVLTVMEEAGDPIMLGLRLQLDDGELTELEHVIVRDLTPGATGHTNLDNLAAPRSAFRHSVPPAHRNSREELLEIARAYYDAVIEDDGSLAPFAVNCVRRENGYQTTCKTPPPDPTPAEVLWTLDTDEQLDSGAMNYITDVDPVRVDIADEKTGLVCGLSQLQHAMEETTFDIEGVPGLETIEWDFEPWDTVALHVFKISGGKIRAIEANGFRAPFNAPSGWE